MSKPLIPDSSFGSVTSGSPFEGIDYALHDPALTRDSAKIPCLGASYLKNIGKIRIWDPYYKPDDVDFFSEVNTENVSIEILTIEQNPKNIAERSLTAYLDRIHSLLCDRINLIDFDVTIAAVLDNDHRYLADKYPLWHDRFLLADDEVYLMGHSVSGQIQGRSLYGICHLYEYKDQGIVRKYYDKYWDYAKNYGAFVSRSEHP